MRDPQTLALLTLAATLTLLPWVTGEVHVQCQNSWIGGFHGEVRFDIHQTLTVWQVHIIFEVRVDDLQMLDSNVSKISDYDFLVTPKNNDRVANPGDTLVVSFNGVTPGANLNPVICAYIVGVDADWACPGITAPPTTATTTTPVTTTAVPAHTTTISSTTASTTNTPVTIAVDPCLSLTCRPGHCVVLAGRAVCDCSGTGYTGTHCKINPCDGYDCGPGLCERHGTPSAYAVCDCSGTGFTGDHCQYQISIVGRASS